MSPHNVLRAGDRVAKVVYARPRQGLGRKPVSVRVRPRLPKVGARPRLPIKLFNKKGTRLGVSFLPSRPCNLNDYIK